MNFPAKKLTYLCAILVCLALVPMVSAADTIMLPNGAKLDLSANCPVCNMKVGSTMLGPAAVVLKDGKVVGFDSTGDMFRYLLEPKKYGFDPAAIQHVYVTQYETKSFIDAKQALYVVGSDAKGSMGPGIVPFAKKEDADKFMSDHHGKKIVSYGEVELSDLKPKKGLLKMDHSH
jgi:copper chaperone NosL